jgi:hypothetical protein
MVRPNARPRSKQHAASVILRNRSASRRAEALSEGAHISEEYTGAMIEQTVPLVLGTPRLSLRAPSGRWHSLSAPPR